MQGLICGSNRNFRVVGVLEWITNNIVRHRTGDKVQNGVMLWKILSLV